ncbi:hypothetical protein PR048_031488 [Dryococelus australis]|uniref:Uncharacterized protein n=1 Tax=Dryococelus australis TaxID=614101 RepID=A0ABQ9G5E5_9NEOP|nr:hypothetical protein PR048_031488 [Dryococelus australis]
MGYQTAKKQLSIRSEMLQPIQRRNHKTKKGMKIGNRYRKKLTSKPNKILKRMILQQQVQVQSKMMTFWTLTHHYIF